METPKTVNGITRRLDKQAFGGYVRDFIFESQDKMTISEFFNKSKPLIQETLDLFKKETKPVKICSTIKNDQNDSDTVYAVKLEDYNLDKIICELKELETEKSHLKFYLNVTRYEPSLEFMVVSDSESEHDDYGYHQCNEEDDDSLLFTLNPKKWHEDGYDPSYNMYFY